jgi:hypothetical protein
MRGLGPGPFVHGNSPQFADCPVAAAVALELVFGGNLPGNTEKYREFAQKSFNQRLRKANFTDYCS